MFFEKVKSQGIVRWTMSILLSYLWVGARNEKKNTFHQIDDYGAFSCVDCSLDVVQSGKFADNFFAVQCLWKLFHSKSGESFNFFFEMVFFNEQIISYFQFSPITQNDSIWMAPKIKTLEYTFCANSQWAIKLNVWSLSQEKKKRKFTVGADEP